MDLDWLHKLASINYGSEDDLIAKIVLPFFERLGYNKEDWEMKYAVRTQEGSKPGRPKEADIVFFNGPEHKENTSLLVVETKKDGPHPAAEAQAKFYADNLKASFYVFWEGKQFTLVQYQRYRKDRIVKKYVLDTIDESKWFEIESLLSRKSILEFCERNEIKIFSLPEKYRESVKMYKKKLQRELEVLDFLGKKLNLKDCYVKLRVYEGRPKQIVEEPELARIHEQEHIDKLRHPERILSRSESLKPEQPEDVLSKNRRLVLVGDPGAGKSTLLKYLTLELVSGKTQSVGRIPLFVEAKRLAAQKNSLWEFVAKDLKDRFGFSNPEAYLDESARNGKLALLIDGIDEMPSEAPDNKITVEQLCYDITTLSTRWDNIHIIVTSRKASWDAVKTPVPPAFKTYELCEFDDADIEKFITKWPFEDETLKSGLSKALAKNKPMRRLGATPLLMALIALTYENRLQLPERRSKLYERCVDLLLEKWDSSRRISRRHFVKDFTNDRKLDLMKEVAWRFHRERKAYFPRKELLEVIRSYLPQVHITENLADNVLEEITIQHGLLKELSAEKIYGFLHLTLQEYFAAKALYEEKNVDFLQDKFHDPWWREVVLLYANMGDAGPLLHSVLQSEEDIFFSNLLCAGRCLVGTPRVSIPGLREQVISKLFVLIYKAKFGEVKLEAISVLSEIGGREITEAFLQMLSNEKMADSARWRIAYAIGRLGCEAEHIPTILATFKDSDIREPLYRMLFQVREQLSQRILPQDVGMKLSDFADI